MAIHSIIYLWVIYAYILFTRLLSDYLWERQRWTWFLCPQGRYEDLKLEITFPEYWGSYTFHKINFKIFVILLQLDLCFARDFFMSKNFLKCKYLMTFSGLIIELWDMTYKNTKCVFFIFIPLLWIHVNY